MDTRPPVQRQIAPIKHWYQKLRIWTTVGTFVQTQYQPRYNCSVDSIEHLRVVRFIFMNHLFTIDETLPFVNTSLLFKIYISFTEYDSNVNM